MNARAESTSAPTASPSPKPRARFVDTAELLPNGPMRTLYRPLQPLLERLFGFRALDRVYRRAAKSSEDALGFCRAGLNLLGVRDRSGPDAAIAALREHDGPLLILANHPLGGVDALALCLALERIRPGGWRLMANRMLTEVPEFQGRLLPLDPLANGASNGLNRRGLRQAARWLKSGGVLALFPAGRVAPVATREGASFDLPWSPHALRLARTSGAAIALLHIGGRVGAPLRWIPPRFPRLRSLFLVRELLRSREHELVLRLGPPQHHEASRPPLPEAVEADRLRARCFALADLDIEDATASDAKPARTPPTPSPVRAAGDAKALAEEVERLSQGPALLMQAEPYRLLLFRKAQAPHLFHELGRQREITFRLAGQGSGRDFDETPEDAWYSQLVLWDAQRRCLIGAYRLGFSDSTLAEHGPEGMYLNHVFDIDPDFYRRMGPGIELSRSFVRAEFQGEQRPLALLWRGLGETIARNPRYTNLYGSVTISAAYSRLGRAVLVEYLRRNHGEAAIWRKLVKARAPFVPETRFHTAIAEAFAGPSVDALRPILALSEHGRRPIPPLIRHYLPLGARFIDFHVEAEFGNAVYCLLRVDLRRSPRGHLRRFVGPEASERLLRA